MTDRFSRDLDEALSLYLDGRLEGPAREEFERRMEADPSLRQAVEFHRGLSLEFHEEAPPLPRGYDARARERLRQARLEPSRTDPAGSARGRAGATDRIAPSAWRRLLALETLAVAAALALVVTILYPRLSGRIGRQGAGTLGRAGSAPRALDDSGRSKAEADQQTVDALRSLGYLASGRSATPAPTPVRIASAPRRAAGSRKARPPESGIGRAFQAAPGASAVQGLSPAVAEAPAAGAGGGTLPAASSGTASPAAAPPSVAAASPSPGAGLVPAPGGDQASTSGTGEGERRPPAAVAPAEAKTEQAEPSVAFRAVAVTKGPEPGQDHQVIRSAAEWTAFAAGPPPAELAFDKEMIVVLRDDRGTEPPSRLRVVSVSAGSDAVVIACRIEAREPGTAAPPGQAIILPRSDLPVRILTR